MSEESTVVAATPEAQPAAPAVVQPEGEPKWLPDRLARERNATIKALGFESIEEAKAARAELEAKRNATKTAEEKAAEASAKLASEAARAAELLGVVGSYASRQLASLTPAQQAAVKAIAGEDAAAQLRAIDALSPTWKTEPAPAPAAPQTPAAQPIANTSSAGQSPADGSVSQPNHAQTYQQLKASNPMAAAIYAREHPEAYSA